MFKINFTILFLLSLISNTVYSSVPTCPITSTPTYCPFYLNSASDIPLAASSYNVLNKIKYLNNSIESFQIAHDLLEEITDPLLNGSTILASVESLFTSAQTLLNSHVNNWVTILNNYLRIDVIAPLSTYQSNYNSLNSMKTPYLPLFNQALSTNQQITTIQNNLNGVQLTATQAAQLATYTTVKTHITNIYNFFYAGDYYISTDIGYANDITELPEAYLVGDCDIDLCRGALQMYTEFFLAHAYDFYLARNSINQLNI